MSVSSIPEFRKPTCVDTPRLVIEAARSAENSAKRSEAAAAKAEAVTEDMLPYVGVNGNWWRGDVDLGYPATGPRGPKGDAGEQGPQGPQGPPGEVTSEQLADALKTRTNIMTVTQEEMDEISTGEPNIYIIR